MYPHSCLSCSACSVLLSPTSHLQVVSKAATTSLDAILRVAGGLGTYVVLVCGLRADSSVFVTLLFGYSVLSRLLLVEALLVGQHTSGMWPCISGCS